MRDIELTNKMRTLVEEIEDWWNNGKIGPQPTINLTLEEMLDSHAEYEELFSQISTWLDKAIMLNLVIIPSFYDRDDIDYPGIVDFFFSTVPYILAPTGTKPLPAHIYKSWWQGLTDEQRDSITDEDLKAMDEDRYTIPSDW